MSTVAKKRLLGAALDLCAVLIAFLAKPAATLMINTLPDCIFASKLMPCPSCGGTRAVISLFSGDIVGAFEHNAFFALLAFFLVFLLIILNLDLVFGIKWAEKLRKILATPKTVIVLAICYVAFGVIRTII